MRSRLENMERVLAVRLDNIGDVVMLTPALRALRKSIPQAELTLLTSPQGAEAADLIPGIDSIWTMRALWQDASGRLEFSPERELSFIEELRRRAFDAALIFTSFSQTPYAAAYACYLAGIPVRAGHEPDFGGGLISHPAEKTAFAAHQADRNLEVVRAIGCFDDGNHLELKIPHEAYESARKMLRRRGLMRGGYIIVAPRASCSARTYPEEKFAAAASLLAEEAQCPVVVIGSERDRDDLSRFRVLAAEERVMSLMGETTVPEAAALIAEASLTIANNTAAMHLADAADCPVLGLFSGTDLKTQWEPRGVKHELLQRQTHCHPCYLFECPYQMECLDFSPRQVAAEALKLLRSGSNQPKTGLNLQDEDAQYLDLACAR